MKFRVWDIKHRCYFMDTCYINNEGRLFEDNHYNCPTDMAQEEYKIEYSSGLLDKNGKEVYESDVVKLTEVDHDLILKVIYMNSLWIGIHYPKTPILFGECVEFYGLHTYNNKEIIGNINENPKLLEK